MKGKKALIVVGVLTLLVGMSSGIKASAGYYSARGNISFYYGDGQVGYDGKVLGLNDCATKIGQDNPPAGTPIYLTNLEDQSKRTLYKWDRGTLPNAVLDITYSTWITYQYPTIKGVFSGSCYHF